MKARIPDDKYNIDAFSMLDKFINNKQLAEQFYNFLSEKHPNKEFESFEAWYDKLSTADFLNKVRKIDESRPNRKTRRAAKKKGGE